MCRERVASTSSQGTKKYYSIKAIIGVWAGVGGGGGQGGCSPPNFGQLRFFGQQEKIWAEPVFKTFPCFFLNYYFEEINNFYFNPKSA